MNSAPRALQMLGNRIQRGLDGRDIGRHSA
jgi:hypothetical protein